MRSVAAVCLAVLLALLLWGFKFDGRRGNVVAVHPDQETVWREFLVGGMFICYKDSTNKDLTCIPLPEGSYLLVPFTQKPDSTRKAPRYGPKDISTP